ncbi:CST complex subunit CTC1-like [Gastrolobium bilobum]|uniref:CST complex subunit CTC1-like n=1 Tax=Gastrolobium bilobum TaxID=150636 RepID=UPI002AB1B1AD|nr:CST complex subunit CTC1-like [Gastrolobium bilobum]
MRMRSNKSSTFVEAILLPYILLLAGKSGISHPCNVSRDKTKELSKYCISGNNEEQELSKYCVSGNNEEQVSNKRQKLIKESVSSLKDEFRTSIYELNACSNRESKEKKICVGLNSSHDLSCLVTFRSLQNENVICPAVLRSTSSTKEMSFNSKPTARKIFLEFSSDRFFKYQSLHIGGYYIIEHDRKDCFCTTKDDGYGSSGTAKFLVDSGKHIWSLSFISDEVLFDYKSEYTTAKDSLSPTIDGVLPKIQIEQLLLRSNDDYSGVCSNVCLYLPISHTGFLDDKIIEPEDSQSLQLAISEKSSNISLSTGTAVATATFCSGSLSSNCLFPEGKLISLEGNVVEIHDIGFNFCNSRSSGASLDALQLKDLVGTRRSFCIHVLVHHHIVNIFGSISKYAFPTGLGPGVTATFHRILDARAQNKFMLLPVSFIVIKSMKVYDKQCSDRSSNLRPTKDAYNASQDYFSYLISQLPQCQSHTQIVLRCRVVAVIILVLERKNTYSNSETKNNTLGTLLDIPLAGFLLDDGSSSCCCWANAERAATLLGLHEELTTSYHLERILKNYKRITVKNHGLSIYSPYQDLVVSVTPDNALCISDENLLKFIIFNACVGRIWNVVASVMDAEEVRQLEKEYLTEMVNMQSVQNIWAKEVSWPRTLAEARNMLQELLKS